VAALSGSCSEATRAQVARHAAAHPARALSAAEVMAGRLDPGALADWAMAQGGVPLIHSAADPGEVAAAQARFGREAVAAAIERLFAALAAALLRRGCARLVTAGGETSGAVVTGLGLARLAIGPEIAPGIPAMRGGDGLVLALKSGNFGPPDFFETAARALARGA
jgi:uncharacterized protein YgbK (DUF1537 family)